jgi:hypothetical protein
MVTKPPVDWERAAIPKISNNHEKHQESANLVSLDAGSCIAEAFRSSDV